LENRLIFCGIINVLKSAVVLLLRGVTITRYVNSDQIMTIEGARKSLSPPGEFLQNGNFCKFVCLLKYVYYLLPSINSYIYSAGHSPYQSCC